MSSFKNHYLQTICLQIIYLIYKSRNKIWYAVKHKQPTSHIPTGLTLYQCTCETFEPTCQIYLRLKKKKKKRPSVLVFLNCCCWWPLTIQFVFNFKCFQPSLHIILTNCCFTIHISELSVDVSSSISFFYQKLNDCSLFPFHIHSYSASENTDVISAIQQGLL